MGKIKIPFVDLTSQYESIKKEINQAIYGVIQSAAFIGGEYVQTFERSFANYIGVKHCIGVGNGTEALFIALKSLGVGAGDEVITVANSFIGTSEAITMTNAKVVFVDCETDYYRIDCSKVEAAITRKTKAIIPVHLYGQMADMNGLKKLADQHGLFVVEDCAQAHGATFQNRRAGTTGHCGCFSFFPGKNLGAYGDAGAVVTDNEELAMRIRMYANHGRIDKYNHELEGVNSRLDGLQAAILDVKLNYLGRWTERRNEIARMYEKALNDVVAIPLVHPDNRHVYHLYVIRVENRDKVKGYLAEQGISTGIHYPVPLPFLNAYKYLGHKPENFPMAYSLKDKILSLPIHGSMPDEAVEYVIKGLRDALKKYKRV